MFKNKDAVGRRLQNLRKEKKLTGLSVANSLGCTQSFISKIENGKIKPTQGFVREFCKALRLPKDIEQELSTLTEAFLFSFDRWSRDEVSFSDLQNSVLAREANSSTIRSFQWNLVNGLLQTKDYATAVFSSFESGSYQGDIEKAVAIRMKRQQILKNRNKKLILVHSEAVLGNFLLPPSKMKLQLELLWDYVGSANFEIRILPLCKHITFLPVTSFVIFDETVIEVEVQHAGIYLWEKEEIDLYSILFNKIFADSVTGNQAKKIIENYIAKTKVLLKD